MKLLFVVLSALLVSCGGSSSGGGSSSNPKLLGPEKPNGPKISMSLENAKKQLRLNKDTFENINPGDSFTRYELCNYTSSTFGTNSGRFVRKFTVISFDKITREISYKVDAIETPDSNLDSSCNGTEIKDKTYILMDNVSTMEGSLTYLDSLKEAKIVLTDLNGAKFIVVKGKVDTDFSEQANIEIGVNLTKNYLVGAYMEMNFKISEYDMTASNSVFAVEQSKVDISNIDLSKLSVYSEDSSDSFFSK